MNHDRLAPRNADEKRAALIEELTALIIMLPLELRVGDRVHNIYDEVPGTIEAFDGPRGVKVRWDDHNELDDELPLPERHELVKIHS